MKYITDTLIDIFKALSDKTRLRIFWVLHRADCELCVCEIIDVVEENQYNVSRHLKILKYADLVKEHKQGRFVHYSTTKSGDKVHKIILDLFSAISGYTFAIDSKRLTKRLSMRKGGRCVVGMYGKKVK
jgi:ArsR family transcriptional regulator